MSWIFFDDFWVKNRSKNGKMVIFGQVLTWILADPGPDQDLEGPGPGQDLAPPPLR